jgi:hypothetical protein
VRAADQANDPLRQEHLFRPRESGGAERIARSPLTGLPVVRLGRAIAMGDADTALDESHELSLTCVTWDDDAIAAERIYEHAPGS